MCWTGSIDKNWTNQKTDEFIEFKKQDGKYHVWLRGQVDGRKRGKKIGESERESQAKQIALNKIDRIGEERYFSRYE